MPNSDGDTKFPKVLKEARDHILGIKCPNKKRLVAEERLAIAERRLRSSFGRFHCKFIAYCPDGAPGSSDEAEILLTSASFHKFHFDIESGDTVVYFRLPTSFLINHYLAPLGLEHQVSLPDSPPQSPSSATPAPRPRPSVLPVPQSPHTVFGPVRDGGSPHGMPPPPAMAEDVHPTADAGMANLPPFNPQPQNS